MFAFVQNDAVDVLWNGTPLFSGIKPYILPYQGQRVYMDRAELQGNTAVFYNDIWDAFVKLEFSEQDDCGILRLSAQMAPQNLPADASGKFREHFELEEGFGFDVAAFPGAQKYMATYRRCEFWVRPVMPKDLSELPENTQSVSTQNADGTHTFMVAVCDDVFKTDLKSNPEGGCSVYARSNDERSICEGTVALAFAKGADPYLLPKQAITSAFLAMGRKPVLREDRKYNEVFEYLGWCSWDAFHMEVTHQDMLDKAHEFKDKNIPVRWVLLDDMWGWVNNNNRPTFKSRRLSSWEADLQRFPQGLKGIVKDIHEKFGLQFGLWHPTTGYWWGIEPQSPLAKEQKDLLFYTERRLLMHRFDLESATKYYDRQHGFYKDCGVDFVKVDNQACLRRDAKRDFCYGEAAKNLHTAIETATEKYFDGALINCMGMTSENFWNRPASAVSRFSGDFKPEDRAWFVKHLLQCSFNALVQGTVYVGDWDMWWSDDGQAVKNAVLRAMCGGPVYMSDELGRSVRETIMPIVYSDGRIIRLQTPAIPTRDCLFDDPGQSGKIFKVRNRIGKGGVIAAFNMDDRENAVCGTVSAADLDLEPGTYCVYDWFEKTATLVTDESLEYTLKDYDDFKLLLFVPVEEGVAFIGLQDKYMSPATLTTQADGFTVGGEGNLLVYGAEQIQINGKTAKGQAAGQNLYVYKVAAGDNLKK